MRLSLTLGLLFAGGCAAPTAHRASTRLHVYSDSRITAVSPAVSERATFENGSLAATYSVDAVSGATSTLTVDAVTTATRFSDRRHQLGVVGSRVLGPGTELSAGYGYGVEADHSVHAPSVGAGHDLLGGRARVSLRYGLALETVGRADLTWYRQRSTTHRLDAGVTTILHRHLSLVALGTVTYARCDDLLGCVANPYRYVGVSSGADVLAMPERNPAERSTFAAAARLSASLTPTLALHLGYRLGADTFRVVGHTLDAALAQELLDGHLLVRGELRGMVQGPASFYASRYFATTAGAPAYRTADGELSRVVSARLSVHVEGRLGPARWIVMLGRLFAHYPDFHSLPRRDAWIAGAGLDVDL